METTTNETNKDKDPKETVTGDLLEETTPEGRKKLAISRIFLIIFLVFFMLTLIYLLVLLNIKPATEIVEDYISILDSKIEGIKVVLQALEWIIGLLLIYALGSKGFHWASPMMGRPINEQPRYPNGSEYTNIVIADEVNGGKKRGSLENPGSIKEFNN